MIISHEFQGQLCWVCGGQIWGDGIFDATPDDTGTTSYHRECWPYKAYYLPPEIKQQKTVRALLKDLLRTGYFHYDAYGKAWCNYCGEHWISGDPEVHNFTCPIERGKKLLEDVK